MSQKPLLPNNHVIWDVTISKRESRALNCEIYHLKDNSYLYIFIDLQADDVLSNKLKKYNYKPISIWLNTYVGIIHKKFDIDFIEKVKKDLTSHIWFEAIAGMHHLKDLFMQEVIEPLKNPEKYKKYKLSIPNGVLFFWPPWCGKTFMSRKLAEEIGYNFYEIKHSDIASPYIHGSTGKIWEVFSAAKENSPSIVFFDEISGLVPKRENIDATSSHKEEEVNEFLMQLNDASKNNILVIGATNYPDRIDTAIMRSGRMDKRIYIWPPDYEARIDLFKMYLKSRPIEEIDYEKLATMTEQYVSADIQVMCDNFARKALAKDSLITMKICKSVIQWFKPSLTQEQIDYYNSFIDDYQRI
jgi:transitional endoplasmic reticulum ATPase